MRSLKSDSVHANSCGQVGAVQPCRTVEIRFVARLGVLVPGTRELAIVAAVDAVSDQRAKTFRNASLELDGQVGNAARASSSYGATIAPVGQASRQARHVPQCALTAGVTGNGRSV
jgi:hypothetical protein